MKPLSKLIHLFVLVTVLVANLAALRKNEDPIQDTQTDPITYKQKVEETKDGVKGAPAPSFKFYEKEQFLEKAPTATGSEEPEQKTQPLEDDFEVSEVNWDEDAALEEEPAEDAEDEEWWVEDEAEDEESLEESPKETDLQG